MILTWNHFGGMVQSLFQAQKASGSSSYLHCIGGFMGSAQRKCFHRSQQCLLSYNVPVAYTYSPGNVQCYFSSVFFERIFDIAGHPICKRVCTGLS